MFHKNEPLNNCHTEGCTGKRQWAETSCENSSKFTLKRKYKFQEQKVRSTERQLREMIPKVTRVKHFKPSSKPSFPDFQQAFLLLPK